MPSSRVMSVVGGSDLEARDQTHKRARVMVPPNLSFTEEDKQGTLQPHDDALVVTVRIGGYDVRRVYGSRAEIMYLDLYWGLNLRPEDLDACDSPLMDFDNKMVVPQRMIKLLIQVQVNFIVVEAFSLYTTILSKP